MSYPPRPKRCDNDCEGRGKPPDAETNLRFRSQGIEGTRQAGRALGAAAADRGLVLALVGALGAGKTVFVKGLAEGLGIDPAQVASPTFAIVNEYPGECSGGPGTRLAHVDLYRLERSEELAEVGFLDLLEPDAVVAVEWGDRFPEALPADRLVLELVRPDGEPESRLCEASALGDAAAAVLVDWQESLSRVASVEMER